jgi:hypothetical protein
MLLCSELSVLLMAFESVRVTLGEVETPTREVQSSLPSFRLVLEACCNSFTLPGSTFPFVVTW